MKTDGGLALKGGRGEGESRWQQLWQMALNIFCNVASSPRSLPWGTGEEERSSSSVISRAIFWPFSPPSHIRNLRHPSFLYFLFSFPTVTDGEITFSQNLACFESANKNHCVTLSPSFCDFPPSYYKRRRPYFLSPQVGGDVVFPYFFRLEICCLFLLFSFSFPTFLPPFSSFPPIASRDSLYVSRKKSKAEDSPNSQFRNKISLETVSANDHFWASHVS